MPKTSLRVTTLQHFGCLQVVGSVPDYIKQKALSQCERFGSSKYTDSWKKLPGLRTAYSCRINRNFRILLCNDQALLLDHDRYDTQIKCLKKQSKTVHAEQKTRFRQNRTM